MDPKLAHSINLTLRDPLTEPLLKRRSTLVEAGSTAPGLFVRVIANISRPPLRIVVLFLLEPGGDVDAVGFVSLPVDELARGGGARADGS